MTAATITRRVGEIAVPGALVGALAGGFAGLLAALGGQPTGWATVTMVTLILPLSLLGAGYGGLLAAGKFRPGVFAPAALYWLLGFPLARLLHEWTAHSILTGYPKLPNELPGFLAFQAMVSLGFAIGFLWVHERIMPRWLIRIRAHNPRAQTLLARYLQLAEQVQDGKRYKQPHRGKRKQSAPS